MSTRVRREELRREVDRCFQSRRDHDLRIALVGVPGFRSARREPEQILRERLDRRIQRATAQELAELHRAIHVANGRTQKGATTGSSRRQPPMAQYLGPTRQERIDSAVDLSLLATREERPASSGVDELEVSAYRVLESLAETYDDLDHDHVPSKASVRKAIDNQRRKAGRPPLTKKQAEALERNLTAVAIRHEIHAAGRTHSTKNTTSQIKRDAKDLRAAAEKDLNAHIRNLKRDAPELDAEELEAMKRAVHARNETLGIYDDPIPAWLWQGPALWI